MVYGDYKAAFDKVVIRLLIIKLARFGIGRKTAKWVCQFLTGRSNYVQIGSDKSRMFESLSGVPPGSSLGPLMFTTFIDDVVDCVEFARTLLFADDIKLASIIHDFNDTQRMQQDIDNVMRWNSLNRLHFNKRKCSVFSAYRNDSAYIEARYKMEDHVIERFDEINDLGVLTDRRLHYGHHIEQMKARRMIGCIKHHSNGNFTKETQRILYLAYVRSRLEFASPIWNPSAQIYKDDIEAIQKQFVIYLLQSRANATSYRLAPYVDRCKQLDFQSLDVRRTVADAAMAFDIYKCKITDDLISPMFVRSDSGYDLRDSTSRLLVEPRHVRTYLVNQPMNRLIRTVNENKLIVLACDEKRTFKAMMFEALGC